MLTPFEYNKPFLVLQRQARQSGIRSKKMQESRKLSEHQNLPTAVSNDYKYGLRAQGAKPVRFTLIQPLETDFFPRAIADCLGAMACLEWIDGWLEHSIITTCLACFLSHGQRIAFVGLAFLWELRTSIGLGSPGNAKPSLLKLFQSHR